MLTKEMIPFGRENAISRPDLVAISGLSDHTVRLEIAELRAVDDGTDEAIVSVSTRSGYYRTTDPQEIEHFKAEMEKRIRMTYRAIKVAKRKLKRLKARNECGEGIA